MGTSRLMKVSLTKKRLIIASILASTTVFIVFTPFEHWLTHPLGKIVLSAFLVLIGFGFRSLPLFLKTLCMFYMTSFLAGGIIIGFHSLYLSSVYPSASLHHVTMFEQLSHVFLFVTLPFLWGGFIWMEKTVKIRKRRHAKHKKVTVSIDGKMVTGTALIDTGNHLKDPLTKTPVMVMNLSLLKSIVSEKEYLRLREIIQKKNWEQVGEMGRWKDRFRLIPYRTAGQEMNIMVALRSDVVIVHERERDIPFKSFLIGLEQKGLSTNGDFHIVFPAEALEEAWETIA